MNTTRPGPIELESGLYWPAWTSPPDENGVRFIYSAEYEFDLTMDTPCD